MASASARPRPAPSSSGSNRGGRSAAAPRREARSGCRGRGRRPRSGSASPAPATADSDFAACRSVADGILDEIADRLGEQLAMAEQRHWARRRSYSNLGAGFFRERARTSRRARPRARRGRTRLNCLRPVSASERLISSTAVRIRISESAWRMTLPSSSSCSCGSVRFRRGVSGRAQAADRRAQVVRKRVGQHASARPSARRSGRASR